jgi:hypothetical protein
MKKIILAITLVSSLSVLAQKKNTDILSSKNIEEIENFLKTSHPDDSRRIILKSRLITLKNESWMKPDQRIGNGLKPVHNEIPIAVMQQKNTSEEEEFKKLTAENGKNQDKKTVKLLNQIFENDASNKEAILMVHNKTDCNIIVRIKGGESHNLAVRARGENSVALKKADYQLTSNVCGEHYVSKKTVNKNIVITLASNKPILKVNNVASRQQPSH